MLTLSQRGLISPNRWIYVAEVVAGRLDAVIEARAIEEPYAGIPVGVYKQALAFLRLALEAKGSSHPTNPPASYNAYRLVADSVRKRRDRAPMSSREMVERLEQVQCMLERLRIPGDLSDEEVALAEMIRDFFTWLSREGEAEILRRNTRHHTVSPHRAVLRLGKW